MRIQRPNDDEIARLLLDTVPSVMLSIREEMRSIARGRFTVPQFRILNRLRKGRMTNSEIAEWMGVAAPTMSRMLEPLEGKDLIVRESNPNDRRSQSLTLSPTGKREAEKIRRQALEVFASRVEKLSSEDSASLARGLQVLSKMFSDQNSDLPTERNKPNMSTRMTPRSLTTMLALFTLATSLSSCLGDKTVKDYADEESRRQQAELQEIAGTYRGALVSKDLQQPMGNLTLVLGSYTTVQSSSDGLTKIQVPIAKGTLIYNGLNKSQINFEQYYYNSKDRSLQIQVPVTDASKTTQILSFKAKLSGDTLTGDLEALGGYSSSFTLVKNGPDSQVQKLSTARATAVAAGTEVFEGFPNSNYHLTIQYPGYNSQQLFLNVFLPERVVAVTLTLGGNIVSFPSATLDERYDSLTGEGGYDKYSMRLQCQRTGQGTPAIKWDCTTTAGKRTERIVFTLPRLKEAK